MCPCSISRPPVICFIKILQARELPPKDLRNNTSSPYIRVYALPTRRHNHRTTVIEKTCIQYGMSCLSSVDSPCQRLDNLRYTF
ncbi:hypothetical protein OS493_018123 [Desmophyllum pertusum]|uniref:C2 domain-containing protein n=1 Tax=Desmophyllum pertusum TaxID=174260 RepID=A0A9W9YNK9_9CNID|nr:hypothetical protein OS493_018123 [Desmophyllum pertusum]